MPEDAAEVESEAVAEAVKKGADPGLVPDQAQPRARAILTLVQKRAPRMEAKQRKAKQAKQSRSTRSAWLLWGVPASFRTALKRRAMPSGSTLAKFDQIDPRRPFSG